MAASEWEYLEASDRLLGDVPGEGVDCAAELLRVPKGEVFLRRGEQRLELCWDEANAVIGHSQSEDEDLECAITESSLDREESMPKAERLDWTCSCCGVMLGQFARGMHVGRDVAVEIFMHVLTHNRRPETCAEGSVVWMPLDLE